MKEKYRLVYYCENEGIIKENFFEVRGEAVREARCKFNESEISYPWVERINENGAEIIFDIFDVENCF